MNRLDGKVALISGAARGIGAETAKLMIEAGAKVAIGDVLDERGRETARALGDSALYHHLDVTREEDWQAAIVAATQARFGGLDILVNNAGMFLGKGIEEASLDEWHRLCAVNLTGVFLGSKLCGCWRCASKPRTSTHGSAIVNLASVVPDWWARSSIRSIRMTKGGVTLFTKSAALEFARKGYRIRVNSIHPGVIQTDMGEQTFTARARNLGSNDVDAARDGWRWRTHPIGRLGVPNDIIAKGIVFLASDDCRVHDRRGACRGWRADGAVVARRHSSDLLVVSPQQPGPRATVSVERLTDGPRPSPGWASNPI